MVELKDTAVLEAAAERRESLSLSLGTKLVDAFPNGEGAGCNPAA